METPSATSRKPVPLTSMDACPDPLDRSRYYAEFAPLVHRLIRQYGQDADLREELTGELYCRFCALMESFDPNRGVPLRAYIVHQLSYAAHTYARQQWRIRKKEMAWEFAESHLEYREAIDPTAEWLSKMAQRQIAQALPSALEQLSARQRNIVIWRYYEERSTEEIAESLAIKTATVRSLLRHALTKLRKAIQAIDPQWD